MSTAPPAPAPLNNGKPAPAARPAQAAVIRRVGGVEETFGDRVLTRHLPAWVTSGLVHLGIVLLAYLIAGGSRPDTADAKTDKVLATTVEKEPVEPFTDPTNEDPGFDSNIEAAADVDKQAEKTIDMVATEDPAGTIDPSTMDSPALNAAGLPSLDVSTAGAVGDTGTLQAGAGGMEGSLQSLSAHPGRSGATKDKLLKEGGGSSESEQAVARGLNWLARQQKSDGHWEFDAKDPKLRIKDWSTSTGLALLPFLAAGATQKTTTGSAARFQKTVNDGLTFLTKSIDLNTGKFNYGSDRHYMYGHAMAAMALNEAYGMTRDKKLLPAARAATAFIVNSQGIDGSWGYLPKVVGDTSIVGWQLQALRAAQLTKDIVVPEKCIRDAIKFLDSVATGSRKSAYGYKPGSAVGEPGTSLTAVGLLCRYYMDGWGPGNPGMTEGVPGLFGKPKVGAKADEPQTDRKKAPLTRDQWEKNKATPDMYYFYYATQVVHFFEGPEWKEWNEGPRAADGTRAGGMRDWLIGTQNTTDQPLIGSWAPDPRSIGSHCGRVGTTCLCLLTLEVYYRHLPLYKRTDGGGIAALDK